MKKLIIVIGFCVPFVAFGQSDELIDSISTIVRPYVMMNADSLWNHQDGFYRELDIDGDKQNEILVAVIDTAYGMNKIFVFKRKAGRLIILDSSAPYQVDGRGPRIELNGTQLKLIHTFHHGGSSITYSFDTKLNKYLLVKLFYGENETVNGGEVFVSSSYVYDVKNQTVTSNVVKGSYTDSGVAKKGKNTEKRTYKKLPAGISLKLSDMKDSYDYDFYY